uniref:Protein kinase domain-containing protein n=1 Tax=Romanomermis culicivorax TaxID=13658 RepID=A0A915JGE1_ROMCU
MSGEFGDVCRGILLLDCPDRTSGDYSVVDDPVSTIHYQSSSIAIPSSSMPNSYEQPPSVGREQLRLIVAVKILKNETFCAKARRNFLSEAFIMGQFRHTNVVRLIGVVNNFDQPAMIVIEYMQNGSLNNFLKVGVLHVHVITTGQ